MIGGTPIVQAPQFAQVQPMTLRPGHMASPPRQPWPPPAATPGRPAAKATASAPMPQPTRARAKNDEVTAPAPTAVGAAAATTQLALPPPEHLGIASAKVATYPPQAAPEAVDWNAVHFHRRRIGAIAFQLVHEVNGVRATFLMPTAQPDRTQRIEALAATEAEAVRLALAKAEEGIQRR